MAARTQANRLLSALDALRSLLYILGVAIILLALLTRGFSLDIAALYAWAQQVFGPVFGGIYLTLTLTACYALQQLGRRPSSRLWYEVGLQASAGIATLALTFTLLGIALGIESLSRQSISPETIEAIIQSMTGHFATAFLTTVLGLPTANILRAAIAVRWVALQEAHPTKECTP